MRTFFLTLDLEEWYHLDYFKAENIKKTSKMLDQLSPFLDMLDRLEIRISVFVLGELIEEHSQLIKTFSDRGHENRGSRLGS